MAFEITSDFHKAAHVQVEYASSTVYEIAGDTIAQLHDNLKDPAKKQYLIERNWHRDDSIAYTFNSAGFRAQELDSYSGDYFLATGCSFTFGTGLQNDQTWPTQLSKIVGCNSCNIGTFGASLDTCYRLTKYVLATQKVKPKFIVLLEPPMPRVEVVKLDQIHSVVTPDEVTASDQLSHWFLLDLNMELQREKNIAAFNQLAKNYSIPLYIEEDFVTDGVPLDSARDFAHQGPLTHTALAKRLANRIN